MKLGERIKPETIHEEISPMEAKEILEKKGFEVFLRPFLYQFDEDDVRQEVQLLAWHTRLGIFVNGSSYDNGSVCSSLDIKFQNTLSHFGSISYWKADMMSHKEIQINLLASYFTHTDILSRIVSFVESAVRDGDAGKISLGHKKNGKVSYFGLRSYGDWDDRERPCELAEENYRNTFSMLPASGKRFVLDHIVEI